MGQGVFIVGLLMSWFLRLFLRGVMSYLRYLRRQSFCLLMDLEAQDAPCARVACNFCLEDGVALLVVGNRLEVHVHIAFGGFHLEAWLTRC